MDEDARQAFASQIGRRLRRARESREFNHLDLAMRSGIKAGRIERCEAGKCRITVAELETLAAALKIPLLYFFEGCAACGND